jgi:hypothetical protein
MNSTAPDPELSGSNRPDRARPSECPGYGAEAGEPVTGNGFRIPGNVGMLTGAETGHAWALEDAGRLDKLSQCLALAGLRLAHLRARLDGAQDQILLGRVTDDLDSAIAEVRHLALAARQPEGN